MRSVLTTLTLDLGDKIPYFRNYLISLKSVCILDSYLSYTFKMMIPLT